MRRLPLFLFATLFYNVICAQHDISGVYFERQSNDRIELSHSQFKFIKYDMFNRYIDFVYANATYRWIDDEFVEFQSQCPKNVVDSTLKITQTYNGSIKNKKKRNVKLTLPNIHYASLYTVRLYYDMGKRYQTKWKMENMYLDSSPNENRREFILSLPWNAKKIFIIVQPSDIYANIRPFDRLYDSYVLYEIPEFWVDYNANCIEINIEGLEDGYFGNYWINGEYAKIEKDKIIWRGKVYDKQNDQESE